MGRKIQKGLLINLLASIVMIFSSQIASANFSYEGYLTDSAGSPVASQVMQIKLQIQNPTDSCMLYEEIQTVTTGTDGYFSLIVGSSPAVSNTIPFSDIFINQGSMSTATCSYSPASGDNRKMAVSVSNDSGSTWDSLGVLDLTQAPFASVAESVGGFRSNHFLRVMNGSTPASAPALTLSDAAELVSLIAGTSAKYMSKNNSAGASLPMSPGTPGSAATGSIWYDSTTNVIKFHNGSGAQTLGAGGSGISSLNGETSPTQAFSTPGTSGTAPAWSSISGAHTLNIPMASTGPSVTAGLLSNSEYITLTNKLDATAGADANTASTLVKRDASGNFAAGAVSLSSTVYRDSSSNTVTIQAPTTVTTPYTLKYPAAQGANSQILVNDGSGNLSWANQSGGGLSSSLAPASIFVGDASSVAIGVPLTGDATITNAGFLTVNGIRGRNISAITPSSGQMLRYDGTGWTPNFVSMFDLRSTITGATTFSSGCTPAQTLTWTSATDNLACTNISIPYTQVTGLGAVVQNNGNSFATNMTVGTNDAFSLDLKTNNTTRMTIDSGGNVGIGTTGPTAALDVKGTFKISGSTSGAVGFAVQPVAGSAIYTLPAADGTSGNVLSTNGSGFLSWVAPPASMTGNTATLKTTLGMGASGGSGSHNTAIGTDAFSLLTSGNYNTAVGQTAGYNITTGSDNTVIGQTAGYNVGTAINNTFVGTGAGYYVAGSNNTFIGKGSGGTPTTNTGTNNVALGFGAGVSTNGINYSVALGSGATASGIGGVAIGSNISAPANSIVIGSNSVERMRIDASGNVGIGTTLPAAKLDVAGNVKVTALQFNGGPAINSIVTCVQTTATPTGLSATVSDSGCGPVTGSHTCTCQFATPPAPATTAVVYSMPGAASVSVGLSSSLSGNTALIKCICIQ